MTGSRCSYQIGAQSIINQDRALLVIGFTSVTRSWLSYMYNTLYIYIYVCVYVLTPLGYNPNVAIDAMATPATLA